MAPEITDWVTAGAAVAAVIAASYFAFKQISVYNRQANIMKDQASFQERQLTFSKLQADIMRDQKAIMENQSAIAEKQNEIAQQQLIIIKDQEADRKNAAMRADLVIKSEAENERVLDLILENKGPGWAREIQVYINGCPFRECPPEVYRLLPGSAAQTEIGPGNKLDYLLEFPGAILPTNLRVDISWVSDNGMHSTNLGFIIPRQQLEAYKQEHSGSPSETSKELRIDAYRKFLKVISHRPASIGYLTYDVIPELELIIPFSSLEVKTAASEIYEKTMVTMNITGKPPSGLLSWIDERLKPLILKEIEDYHK